jgi:hypothetical protein
MSRLDSRNFDPLKIEKVRNLSLATYLTILLIDVMSNTNILQREYSLELLFLGFVTYVSLVSYPHRIGKNNNPSVGRTLDKRSVIL